MGASLARTYRSIVINRNYGLLLAGSFVSGLGSWLLTVAQGWLVLQLGNSDFLLGLANFAQMAPLLVLGIVGGAVADQLDRRSLMLATQGVSVLASAVLAGLAVAGRLGVPALLLVALTMGLASAFQWPTWSAFIKDLVGPEHLRNAVATNSARFNLTRVLGPAIGGIILANWGAAACLVLGAAMLFGVEIALLAIRTPPQQHPRSVRWRDVVTSGVVFAWRRREVRNILLITAVLAVFGSSYQAFLPAVARDVLHTGPQGLGWELGAVGIGAVLGAINSSLAWVTRRPGRSLIVLLGASGAGLLVFAASRSPLLALPALAVVGFSTISFLSTANASVQLASPDHMVGSVMGVWVVANAGLIPVGNLLLGAVAQATDVSLAIGGAGAVCLATCLLVGLIRRPASAARSAVRERMAGSTSPSPSRR